jgi:hypothetical protein
MMMEKSWQMKIPTATQYKAALSTIDITDNERQGLEIHYRALNRSISYGMIDEALGYKHGGANLMYGRLGKKLGTALNFTYDKLATHPDTDWASSSIGMRDTTPRPNGSSFHFVMHDALATALAERFPHFLKAK